jgi:two-component system, LuxR family, response regulator FixJ
VTGAPTVFVVDDNAGVRKSLQALVEAAGIPVETYASASEFLAKFDVHRPGCLILDVRLRGTNGLELQDDLRRLGSILPVLVMTGYADVPTSVRAFKGGAIEFLRKPVPPRELLERIRGALEANRRANETKLQHDLVAGRVAQLTPRERQVMELLAVGNSSKQISTALRVSVRTVEGHRRNVLRKMSVDSAVQLARAIASLSQA